MDDGKRMTLSALHEGDILHVIYKDTDVRAGQSRWIGLFPAQRAGADARCARPRPASLHRQWVLPSGSTVFMPRLHRHR
jgi:hypothetical protein